jgi:adenylate cyclase
VAARRRIAAAETELFMNGEQRKLAAIMFTDLVGYTALTQENEPLALELLEEHNQLLRPIFAKYHGQEIKTIGDSFLVEFASALQAVRCALEIQETLQVRNESAPRERSIQIRFGVHLGDVEHRANDIFGDGVNIASRIVTMSEQSGIRISEDVYRQIRNKIEASITSLGRHQLKGIREPIEVYEIAAPIQQETSANTGSAEKRRVAVLPFSNISPDAKDEYFADGMTEEIISSLSKIRELKVASRSTAFRYKGQSVDPREIGRELGVGSVLEGSVRKHGNRLRITAQLINATDGFHLWSEEYDRELEDVFAIQSDIATRVAQALQVQLLATERRRIEQQATKDLKAYQLYLRGRYFWNKRTNEGFRKAIEYFEQAITRDEDYALAYAGLADCYSLLHEYGHMSTTEAYPKAEAAAKRALEIDDTLAEAHTSLALVRMTYYWDWQGAEREFQRAIELNPEYATAHHWYAGYLAAMGRFEQAVGEIQRARELDPFSLTINMEMGLMFDISRQYDRAIEQYRHTLEMDPNFAWAYRLLGWTYWQNGMPDEAIEHFLEAKRLSGETDETVSALRKAYEASGAQGYWQKELELAQSQEKQTYVSPFSLALICIALGDKDEAFRWLEIAYEEHAYDIVMLKVDPVYDPLRSDPRFTVLLKKMGLEK